MLSRRRRLLLLKKRLLLQYALNNSKKARRYWVHPIIRKRERLGVFNNLVRELQDPSNDGRHKQHFRMSYANFHHLLKLLKPYVTKQVTQMRRPIEPELKLVVTLHHLAEGASHKSIAQHYRLGRSTVAQAIYSTYQALWKVLQPLYLRPPSGPQEWLHISDG